MVFGSSVASWALPSLAFGISSEAKADLAASRDAKKAAILAAARAKAEGQAANVVVSSQEQDASEEANNPAKKALQPASFIDASKSGAGVRGGGPGAGNTYEVTKQATPAPAPPAPAAPEPAPAAGSSDDGGGFGLPSVSLPSLPKLPF